MSLMQRSEKFSITSIIAIPIDQNHVFVEASSIENIQAACDGLHYISGTGAITQLSLEELIGILQVKPMFTP